MSETSVKPFLATKMNCAVVSALISIAFVSQAFAVLRPLVPAKPAPPFNGALIIIGDDSVMGCAGKRLVYDPGQAMSPVGRRSAMAP
jgi:hypothetical protein